MWKKLSLILPVLIPSWRFFKAIEPSPRVQWSILSDVDSHARDWQDFRPRPLAVTTLQMLGRLFWNPAWNDTLFVVSCAERIEQQPTDHSITEIARRIQADIEQSQVYDNAQIFRFRLVFVHRDGVGLVEDIVFLSDPVAISGGAAC